MRLRVFSRKKNYAKMDSEKNYRLGCASVKVFPTVNVAAVRVGGDGGHILTSLHFTISKRVCLLGREKETDRKRGVYLL